MSNDTVYFRVHIINKTTRLKFAGKRSTLFILTLLTVEDLTHNLMATLEILFQVGLSFVSN